MKFTHAARLSAALLLLAPAGALAQSPIFFDDFSGTALGPHWTGLPNPLYAQYSVGNGRLTVDWIKTPLGIPGPTAHAAPFRANFTPHHGDFVATFRLGWEPGTHRNITVALLSSSGPSLGLGEMTYSESLGVIRGIRGGSFVSTPAPGPGTHEFQIARKGTTVHFSLNDQPFGSLPTFELPVETIKLDAWYFVGGHSFEPVFFESITVVPAPSILMAGAGFAIILGLRRRR